MDTDTINTLYEASEQCGRTLTNDETRGLMVLGASGNGKTALVKRLLRVDPVLTKFKINQGGNTLFITVPPEATIKKLANIILLMTGYEEVDDKLKAADAWEIARHRSGLVGRLKRSLAPGPLPKASSRRFTGWGS